MTNANAVTFAKTSYMLAGVASGVIFMSILLSFIPNDALQAVFTQLCWVALPLTAVGTFMGFTSRNAIKGQINTEKDPPEIWRKAKNGAILNAILLVAVLLGAVVRIVTVLMTLV